MMAYELCSTDAPDDAEPKPSGLDVCILLSDPIDCITTDGPASSCLTDSRPHVDWRSMIHLIGMDDPLVVWLVWASAAAASVNGVCVLAATKASANVSITEWKSMSCVSSSSSSDDTCLQYTNYRFMIWVRMKQTEQSSSHSCLLQPVLNVYVVVVEEHERQTEANSSLVVCLCLRTSSQSRCLLPVETLVAKLFTTTLSPSSWTTTDSTVDTAAACRARFSRSS